MLTTDRCRKYDRETRDMFNALDWRDAAERAARWREIAVSEHGTPRDWAVAAYLQSISDRKRPAPTSTIPDDVIFMQWNPEQYIDQGGPCGHSDPYTGADDCLCRDGYVIPAYISDGLTPDYCDGEPADRLFAREHAEHCPQHRTDPWF